MSIIRREDPDIPGDPEVLPALTTLPLVTGFFSA
jgi:hypothetical protein